MPLAPRLPSLDLIEPLGLLLEPGEELTVGDQRLRVVEVVPMDEQVQM